MNWNYNKHDMWLLFNDKIMPLHNSNIKNISKLLNINVGTVNRWILKKEVPPQYFNDFNKMLNYSEALIIEEESLYKVMDQFYTKKDVAQKLTNNAFNFIKNNFDVDLTDYFYIEPSAGNGSFLDAINSPNKIGMDISPKGSNIIKKDFFDFYPKTSKNIVIGNPPFGLRGRLALKFINHAANFADFIAFILPPLFNSDGKGSPMLRVFPDLHLVYNVKIDNSSYFLPNNTNIDIHSNFQIWTRLTPKTNIKPLNIIKKDCHQGYIKVYAMSNGPTSGSKRNVKMIGNVDFYLPSTSFNDVELFRDFYQLPHYRGYGIKVLKNKDEVYKVIESIDWAKESFKSTNGANNLRTSIIIDAIERGVKNERKN